MDDIKGKLMGLLQKSPYISCADTDRQYAVNWLMNNGVTVRERGRWVRAGGDLHYSGVLYCCSVCSKRHFVNGRHALVTLSYHDELFRTPNFCPNCGADMRPKGEGEEDA